MKITTLKKELNEWLDKSLEPNNEITINIRVLSKKGSHNLNWKVETK